MKRAILDRSIALSLSLITLVGLVAGGVGTLLAGNADDHRSVIRGKVASSESSAAVRRETAAAAVGGETTSAPTAAAAAAAAEHGPEHQTSE
jgi:hypothetical protein